MLRRAMRRHAGRFVDDTFPPRRPVNQAVTRSPLLSRLEIWRYAGGLRSVKERCVLRGAGRRFHWVTPLPSLGPVWGGRDRVLAFAVPARWFFPEVEEVRP